LIKVCVVTPGPLDNKQRKLFEELAQNLGQAEMPEEKEGLFERFKGVFGS
jgi:DnaJ-class molecular chaperone